MYKPLRLNSTSRNFKAIGDPSIEYEDFTRPPLTDRTNARDSKDIHHEFKTQETALLHQMVLHSRVKSGVRDILRKTLRKRNSSSYGENLDTATMLKFNSSRYTQALEKAKISNWLKHSNTSRVRGRSMTRDSIKI